ncbi:hypothetical protein [uncultured Corynebacterium sp.]|uniref:hypothetical protein n=1 Tax=uncultured Corynebacterium sp. TaxID=159447 RepID=UPI002636293E|nr:hypothetical protein [uncultured Corynebacterium sp.]
MTATSMAPTRTPRRIVGDLSGITALTLVLSGVVGAAWGFFSPRAEVETLGEGSFMPPADYGAHDFPLYIGYLVLVVLGGVVIGAACSRVSKKITGQLVAVVLALVAALTVLATGHSVAYLLTDSDALMGPEGAMVTVRSSVEVGAAFLWAPLAAAATWLYGVYTTTSNAE